jgi:hypothetical protein
MISREGEIGSIDPARLLPVLNQTKEYAQLKSASIFEKFEMPWNLSVAELGLHLLGNPFSRLLAMDFSLEQ